MANLSSSQSLQVLFLSAEAVPFVKVGGLGDVAGALPAALRGLQPVTEPKNDDQIDEDQRPLDIRLVIPFYPSVRTNVCNLQPLTSLEIPSGQEKLPAEVFECELDGLPVYLISGPPISVDGPIYTGNPLVDGKKFVFFSLAALELAQALNWQPHILHANDWHTAPAVYAVHLRRDRDPFWKGTSTLQAVHNLPYHGTGVGPVISEFGLPAAIDSDLPWWAQDLPLPLGLLSADHIVTVSPTYAREILTPEFGAGLGEFLQARSEHLSGILNGLDVSAWDPSTDPDIPVKYSIAQLEQRAMNKAPLQAELDLPQEPRTPVLAMVTRFDPQKGVDLALDALSMLANSSQGVQASQWQAVLLGTGSRELEAAARRLGAALPDRVRVLIAFNDALSRKIFAGADAILIPSRYEPCGLTQMIGMRYGCVPIARATGGLQDTVQDPNTSDTPTGFLFREADAVVLAKAIRRALAVYAEKTGWEQLQRNGMQKDFSWQRSAQNYLELYRSIADRQ